MSEVMKASVVQLNQTSLVGTPSTANKSVDELHKVAQQFEEVFLKEFMKASSSSSMASVYGDSQALESYRQLYSDALAERSAGHVGIAQLIVDQIQRQNVLGES